LAADSSTQANALGYNRGREINQSDEEHFTD
jgi:hypothetical protein